jgi:formylglycine-generating enzyme required for sulfatase activity
VPTALTPGDTLAGRKSDPPQDRDGPDRNPPSLDELPKVILVDFGDGVKLELVRVNPGTFHMGAAEDEIQTIVRTVKGKDRGDFEDEFPQRAVKLTQPFYISRYTVTQEQYASVTGKKPSQFSEEGELKELVKGLDTSRFPVENVSWLDAQAYCRRLNDRYLDKLPEVLRKANYSFHLPTEAQWEYACRAKTTSPFHFGDMLNGKQANCDGNYPFGGDEKGPYLRRTEKVGSYELNDWGLYDMHGNVWQWCEDAYDPDFYLKGGDRDPLNAGNFGDPRVLRGGCYNDEAWQCRSARRFRSAPDSRDATVSFRVVLRVE